MAPHSSTLAWKNPMDRGAWQATVHSVAELETTKPLSANLQQTVRITLGNTKLANVQVSPCGVSWP